MQKRQIILLVAALGAVAYAVVDTLELQSQGPKQTAQARQEAQDLVMNLANGLKSTEFDTVEAFTLQHVEHAWSKGLFVQTAQAAATNAQNLLTLGTDYVYQGYLAMNGARMAVIDGREYRPGEELLDGNFRVRSITPMRVVLSSLTGEGEAVLTLKNPGEKRRATKADRPVAPNKTETSSPSGGDS